MINEITIGRSKYLVEGDIPTIKEIAGILDLKFNNIQPTKISPTQKIIKVWGVGELKDYLNGE